MNSKMFLVVIGVGGSTGAAIATVVAGEGIWVHAQEIEDIAKVGGKTSGVASTVCVEC